MWLKPSIQGVYIGSGIGNLDDIVKTAIDYDKGGYKKVSPLFVPRLLINLAAGHISMRFGFKVKFKFCAERLIPNPLTGSKSCCNYCLHDRRPCFG
jgi:hypothetical protein